MLNLCAWAESIFEHTHTSELEDGNGSEDDNGSGKVGDESEMCNKVFEEDKQI